MLYIKITLNIIAILGLLLSLGEMLGFFRDKDRTNFIKIIKEKLECPKDHPGAKKFINDFVHKNSKLFSPTLSLWLCHDNPNCAPDGVFVPAISILFRRIHNTFPFQ